MAEVETTALKTSWKLFLMSLIGLYPEMCFVRWIAAKIRIFAYAKNLILLACYLGFGLGTFLARKKHITMVSLGLMAGLVVLSHAALDLLNLDLITYAFSQFSDLQIMRGATLTLTSGQSLVVGMFGLFGVVIYVEKHTFPRLILLLMGTVTLVRQHHLCYLLCQIPLTRPGPGLEYDRGNPGRAVGEYLVHLWHPLTLSDRHETVPVVLVGTVASQSLRAAERTERGHGYPHGLLRA